MRVLEVDERLLGRSRGRCWLGCGWRFHRLTWLRRFTANVQPQGVLARGSVRVVDGGRFGRGLRASGVRGRCFCLLVDLIVVSIQSPVADNALRDVIVFFGLGLFGETWRRRWWCGRRRWMREVFGQSSNVLHPGSGGGYGGFDALCEGENE